jgi:transposase
MPTSIETAQAMISTLAEQNARLVREVEQLRHRLDILCRKMFGRSSEKVDSNQLSLAFAALSMPEPPAPQPLEVETVRVKTKPTGRKAFPKDVPRRRVVLDVAEADKTCQCGAAKERIGEAVNEKLDYVPASLEIVEIVRPRYACPKCHDGVSEAKAPPQAIEGSLAAEGLLAQIVVSKYVDHLPLHRLEGIFARQGVELSRSTMCGLVAKVTEAVAPLCEVLRRSTLASGYVQVDDTPVTVLAEEVGRFTGRVWVYLDPVGKQVVFDATDSRGRDGPLDFLTGFRGHLQGDAYAGYDAVRQRGGVILMGCMAHVRRYFIEALDKDPQAAVFIALIKRLYGVEREASGLAFAERRALRQSRSAPLLRELFLLARTTAPTVLPKSPLGMALTYLQNQRRHLAQYLRDGRTEIDNNGAERQLRAVVIGRKNWLFTGSMEGAHRAATLYSLVQTCKLAGVEPWEYLRDVLRRLPTHPHSRIPELLPNAWAEARAAAPMPARPAP